MGMGERESDGFLVIITDDQHPPSPLITYHVAESKPQVLGSAVMSITQRHHGTAIAGCLCAT
jgi:hypothetical protein